MNFFWFVEILLYVFVIEIFWRLLIIPNQIFYFYVSHKFGIITF